MYHILVAEYCRRNATRKRKAERSHPSVSVCVVRFAVMVCQSRVTKISNTPTSRGVMRFHPFTGNRYKKAEENHHTAILYNCCCVPYCCCSLASPLLLLTLTKVVPTERENHPSPRAWARRSHQQHTFAISIFNLKLRSPRSQLQPPLSRIGSINHVKLP